MHTVGGGSFNPLTRMHLRTYFLAKQCLEAKYGYVVLGECSICVSIVYFLFCASRGFTVCIDYSSFTTTQKLICILSQFFFIVSNLFFISPLYPSFQVLYCPLRTEPPYANGTVRIPLKSFPLRTG